jgi:hypothetical protein
LEEEKNTGFVGEIMISPEKLENWLGCISMMSYAKKKLFRPKIYGFVVILPIFFSDAFHPVCVAEV